MAAVPFDTLKLARRLEAAGFSPKQAGDMSESLAEAMSGADLATKADLEAAISALEARLEIVRRDIIIWLAGIIVIAVGIILAAMRYVPTLHP